MACWPVDAYGHQFLITVIKLEMRKDIWWKSIGHSMDSLRIKSSEKKKKEKRKKKNSYTLMTAHRVQYNPRCYNALCSITKTDPYNFDPLKPHFYVVKLGLTEVYIIFLFLLKNIDFGYSLEPPRRGGSNEYPQPMFWAEKWKIADFFYLKPFSFGGKIFNVFE